MASIAVFLSDGHEEIEALTVVDLCRRSNIETRVVSMEQDITVTGSHQIRVQCDECFDQVDFDSLDMLVLPGGMPGTRNLEAHEGLMKKVDEFWSHGKYVAAICAAPSILGHLGILQGKDACSYPTFEDQLLGASVTRNPVEISGNVITSRGMGTSIPFGLAIVSVFCGQEKADALAETIVYK